jgi:hypothetical protein
MPRLYLEPLGEAHTFWRMVALSTTGHTLTTVFPRVKMTSNERGCEPAWVESKHRIHSTIANSQVTKPMIVYF